MLILSRFVTKCYNMFTFYVTMYDYVLTSM